MLRMQEIAFPGFKFQKFPGGGCPRTPLLGVACGHACGLRPRLWPSATMLRSDFMAGSAPDVCAFRVQWLAIYGRVYTYAKQ